MFAKTDVFLYIGYFILSEMPISACEKECLRKFTRPALYGYRCVTETEEITRIAGIPAHICNHQCIQRQECRIVNYNTRQNTCFLSKAGCLLLQQNDSFQVNIFGTKHHSECLRWEPPPPPVGGDTSSIISNMCHQSQECSIGRLQTANAIVPGKYLHGSGDIWSIINGAEVANVGVKEILTVNNECQVLWMPFHAGDTLPLGAVRGGHLENSGTTLYVVRAGAGPTLIPLGFYDPVTALGYLAYYGVEEVTDMEILVLL